MSHKEAIKNLDTLLHLFKEFNKSLDECGRIMKEIAADEKAAA